MQGLDTRLQKKLQKGASFFMSTKIYDAYLVTIPTSESFLSFTNYVKEIMLNKVGTDILSNIAKKTCDTYDLSCLHKAGHIDLLYTDFPTHLTAMYDNLFLSSKGIVNQFLSRNEQTQRPKTTSNDSNFQHTRLYRLCTEDTLAKVDLYTFVNRFGIYNIHNAMTFFPPVPKLTDHHQIPCMVFGSQMIEFFDILCNNPDKLSQSERDFFTPYQVQDFHYQNQTDKPDDITDKNWKFRKETWDVILPSGIPCVDGITVPTLDMALFENKYNLFTISAKTLLPYLKDVTKEKRCHDLAVQFAEVHALQEKQSSQTTELSPSDAYKISRLVKESLNQKTGRPYEVYQEYYQICQDLLPETFTTELLNTKIKDFIE